MLNWVRNEGGGGGDFPKRRLGTILFIIVQGAQKKKMCFVALKIAILDSNSQK